MRTIYIDSDFKCHVADDGTMTAVQTAFFDNKCDEVIECYRFVPEGASWTREDGEVFQGEMASPWRDCSEFDSLQRQYERKLLSAYETALAEIEQALGV